MLKFLESLFGSEKLTEEEKQNQLRSQLKPFYEKYQIWLPKWLEIELIPFVPEYSPPISLMYANPQCIITHYTNFTSVIEPSNLTNNNRYCFEITPWLHDVIMNDEFDQLSYLDL